jgi:hypothetical protein
MSDPNDVALEAATGAYNRAYSERKELPERIAAACAAWDAAQWRPIAEAPMDGSAVLIWASPRDGLDGFQVVARYHEDVGWCVDELREATHFRPLPAPPEDV